MTSEEKVTIVTFACSDSVHIYYDKCGVKPVFPYKVHASIDDAKKYLEKVQGVTVPKLIENKSK